MNNYKTACMFCNNRGNTLKITKLRRLNRELPTYVHPVKGYLGLMWDIHERCQYGLHCTNLENMENECRRLARDIEPYITGIVEEQNLSAYHIMLQALRGDFPAVYRYLEREFNKKRRDRDTSQRRYMDGCAQ